MSFESYNNWMVGLSSLTNLAQNIAQFSTDRKNGVDTATAAQKASYNLSMGNYRIGYAWGMAQHGNLSGYATNQFYSYSSPESNALATYSLAMSNWSPWMFFNSGLCCCGGGYGGYGLNNFGAYGGFRPYYC